MPSLNVARYIGQCLESVLRQALEDIQIICIDAGSTDGTWEILQRYAKNDPRVTLIKSDMRSYGHQMNLGLDAATGDYIGIVETDDWIEPDMFERLWKAATEHDADLVKCNYFWFRTTPELQDDYFENLAACKYEHIFRPLEEQTLFTTTPSIWSGIYSREMLVRNGIRFNETPGASYQDTSFHFMVCSCAERAYLIPEALHHYRRDNEASSVNTGAKVFCICDEMHYFEQFYAERPDVRQQLEPFYMALKYEKYRWNFERLSPELQWEFLKTMHSEFAQHDAEGLLRREFFSDIAWQQVRLVCDSPVAYYRERCKVYAARPQGEDLPAAEVLCESQAASPDVSVVMPLYNCERYVRESVGSVLSQTHHNLEVICIDDGSTDTTLDIALSMAASDDRMCVAHQVNEGQSAARNHGMALARGTYLVFLDGDDMLRDDAIAYLLDKARQLETDIIYFDGTTIYDPPSLKELFPFYLDVYRYDRQFEGPLSGKAYLHQTNADRHYRVNAVMTFFRRAFLDEIGISFIEGVFHEDHAFTFESMVKARRVWHTQEQFYLRTVHSNSTVTRGKSLMHLYGFLASLERVENVTSSQPFDTQFLEDVGVITYDMVDQLRDTYAQLEDKDGCWQKLSGAERARLDIMCGFWASNSLRQQLEETAQRERDIVGSVSFKAGRAFTIPGRRLRDGMALLRNHGVEYTVDALAGRDPAWQTADPKVLFVSSDTYRMSGAFLSLIALNKELNEAFGEQTHVVLPYYGSGYGLIEASGVPSTVFESKDWIVPVGTADDPKVKLQKRRDRITTLQAVIDTARLALDGGYTLIHSNTSYTYVGALAAQLAGLPHVWHLREYLEEDQGMQFFDQNEAHRLLGEASQVVAISQSLCDKYAPIVGEDHISVIYNGIDEERFYRPDHVILEGERPILLFVSGSASPYKGRFDLVEACTLLAGRGYDFELWFVGWCGYDLQQAVRERGLTARTRFFGYQRDTERFYEQADICFMCSRFEAFGRTTVEAGMAGCLVIGADRGGTTELIEDGVTGLLYPYGDAQALADVTACALDSVDQSRAMAATGRATYCDRYTAHANAKSIAELHRSIAHDHKPHSAARRRAAYARIAKAERELNKQREQLPNLERQLAELSASAASPADPASDATNPVVVLPAGTPKVSVIVPIYNVEDYLEQCLQSIADQTLHEIEVICVNDGSTDSSPAIIRSFAERDDRFVAVDKPNGGYGSAVNRGMAEASGHYLAIVEPDDFISPTMYEVLYGLATQHGEVDIAKGSYWQYFDTDDGEGRLVAAPINAACHPPKDVFEVWDYPEIIYHHPSIWSCIYRREFMTQSQVRFVEAPGAGWVDNPFLIQSFCLAKSIAWTPEPLYFYRQTNPNASSFIRDCSMPFLRTQEMLAFLDENGIYDPSIRNSVYKRILYNAAAARENPHYDPLRDQAIITEQLRKVDVGFLSDPRVRDKERDAYRYFISARRDAGKGRAAHS